MANGRMITKDICGDKRINELSSDTSRLAFTWLITFADREGRTHGDPAMVRSMLFPRRQDVSIEQMEDIIKEWAVVGLIVWYECNGDLWIWFPGFSKNQPGLRKDKEAPSKIPEPSEDGTELVRSRYGLGTYQVPLKRKEENRREGPEPVNIFRLYESEIGIITPMIADKLAEAEGLYPAEWFEEAFKESAANSKRSWAYAEAILKRWARDGYKSDTRNGGGNGGGIYPLPAGV